MRIRAYIQILDRDEKVRGERYDISDGGVTVDVTSAPDRSLDVTILDHEGRLLTDSPTEEAVEARRFVRAHYAVHVPDHGWMDFPQFTGPIQSMDRQGVEVTIRAVGKEALYLDPYLTWVTQNYHPREYVTDVIRDLLGAQGETKFLFPDRPDRVGRDLTVPRLTEAWPVIVKLCRQIGSIPWFDGSGYLRLRPGKERNIGHTFDGRTILSAPELSADYTTIRNVGVAHGPDPRGFEYTLQSSAALAPANPVSADQMARDDIPRRAISITDISFPDNDIGARTTDSIGEGESILLVHDVDDFNPAGGQLIVDGMLLDYTGFGDIGTEEAQILLTDPLGAGVTIAEGDFVTPFDEAVFTRRDELRDAAKKLLETFTTDIGFDVIPQPHLRPGLLCRVFGEFEDQSLDLRFRLRKYFMPLTYAQPMTIGFWHKLPITYQKHHRRRTWVPPTPKGFFQ